MYVPKNFMNIFQSPTETYIDVNVSFIETGATLGDTDNEGTTTQTESSDLHKWGESETRLMLDKYETYFPEVGPKKLFKTKKKMWEKIALDVNTIMKTQFSAVQVENRYKTILKRKKQVIEHNSQTGNAREEIPFEKEIQKIVAMDDSIQPEVQRSATQVTYKITPNTDDSNEENKRKKLKTKSIQETIREISATKEANRERRHQEKMAIFKEILNYIKPNDEE